MYCWHRPTLAGRCRFSSHANTPERWWARYDKTPNKLGPGLTTGTNDARPAFACFGAYLEVREGC